MKFTVREMVQAVRAEAAYIRRERGPGGNAVVLDAAANILGDVLQDHMDWEIETGQSAQHNVNKWMGRQ